MVIEGGGDTAYTVVVSADGVKPMTFIVFESQLERGEPFRHAAVRSTIGEALLNACSELAARLGRRTR